MLISTHVNRFYGFPYAGFITPEVRDIRFDLQFVINNIWWDRAASNIATIYKLMYLKITPLKALVLWLTRTELRGKAHLGLPTLL